MYRGQRSTSGIIPQALLVLVYVCWGGCFTFVEVGFLAGLELTNYDRLASQWAPGICLYHPSAEVILTGHHTGAFVFVCLLA